MHKEPHSHRPRSPYQVLRNPYAHREPVRDAAPVGGEPAVLVSVLLPNTKADLANPLGELAALAESAGARVVDALMQKRRALCNATALGKGKVEELKERAEANEAQVIIFDNDLSPRQIRALEREVGIKIIDRSELILDIFASRAKTREAQLQVELAQLQYTAPRLRGLWTHLERIAGAGGGTAAGAVGGVGTRGPGERQIEIDRRIVRDRISYLKREIDGIDRRKRREVESRGHEFSVSLVGYTNSGKTTLLNRLTSTSQLAVDMPFATLDTKTTRWRLGDGPRVLLSDTVGFVRDIPHALVASFRATLEETIHADLLLHVVDVSRPTALSQVESVNEVLDDLGCGESPRITLLNKIDVADDPTIADMVARREPWSLRISARTGAGLDELQREVAQVVRGRVSEATLLVPHAEGKGLAEIDRRADVVDRRYTDDGVEIDVRLSVELLSELCGRYQAVTVLKGGSAPGETSLDDDD